MKILFLVESLAVDSGGTALEVVTLAKKMSEVGHAVTVAVCSSRSEELHPHRDVERVCLDVRSLWKWFRSLANLYTALRSNDVVFVTGVWGPIDGLGLRLCWPRRVPVYIRVCGMLEPYILQRNAWKKKIACAFYVKRNLRRAAGIIVNSRPEAARLEKMRLSDAIIMIPNGVPEAPLQQLDPVTVRKELKVPPDALVGLFLGRIHPKKGLHKLLDAMAVRRSDTPPFIHLLVAGSFSTPSYETELRGQIHALNLDAFVHFQGLVQGEVKERLFSAADFFALPSESEGLPNAVLEAMARGLPVLITPGCNMPEVAESGAGVIVESDNASLAEGLQWMSRGKTALGPVGKQARELIKKSFSLSKTIATYNELVCRSVQRPNMVRD